MCYSNSVIPKKHKEAGILKQNNKPANEYLKLFLKLNLSKKKDFLSKEAREAVEESKSKKALQKQTINSSRNADVQGKGSVQQRKQSPFSYKSPKRM